MKKMMRRMLSLTMALLLITSLPLSVLAAVIVDNSFGDVTIGDTHVDHYDSGSNAQNTPHNNESVTVKHGDGDKNGTVTITAGSEETPADVNIIISTGPDTVTNVVLNDAHIDTSSNGGAAMELPATTLSSAAAPR